MIIVGSIGCSFKENSSLRKVLENLNFNMELAVCEASKNPVKKVDYDNSTVADNDETKVFSLVRGS